MNDDWRPSDETLRVLTQVGYDRSDLENEIVHFTKLSIDYPDFLKMTDKFFAQYIKDKHIGRQPQYVKDLTSFRGWIPSELDKAVLDAEGYWVDGYLFQLLYFKESYFDTKIIRSHVKLFLSFLKKTHPLTTCPINDWEPPNWLMYVVEGELSVKHKDYGVFMESFKESCRTRNVPNKLICRYFYKFIEHNKIDQVVQSHQKVTVKSTY